MLLNLSTHRLYERVRGNIRHLDLLTIGESGNDVSPRQVIPDIDVVSRIARNVKTKSRIARYFFNAEKPARFVSRGPKEFRNSDN